MARWSLDKVAMAAVAMVAALALSSCGVASAAKSAASVASAASSATKSKRMSGGGEITVAVTLKWWRNYKVSCKDKGGPDCHVGCPKECPTKCIASCTRCRSFCMCDFFPGTSCGDPRFTGGDGNTFYFHGSKDHSFCIVSDTNLHINAHFIGNHNPELKRDFTWVQALGISFGGGHRLYIGARKTVRWDDDEDHI